MFHSRKLNHRINNIHERALRIVFRDYESTFQQLLKQNKSVSTHQRNLQIPATKIFKTQNEFFVRFIDNKLGRLLALGRVFSKQTLKLSSTSC